MKTKNIVTVALLAAVMCVLSPFSIPIGPIPITFATFALYLIATVKNARIGLCAVIVYLALGAVGVPVFSGFTGGFHKIAGATGGFLIGYIPGTYVIGKLVDKFDSKKLIFPAAMTLGTIIWYTLGAVWYSIQAHVSIGAALAACVIPFIIPDIIKIVVASVVAPVIRRRIP